jgi:hypothetical protein
MVTDVPPEAGPELGETPPIVGGDTYVKAPGRVAVLLSGFVTMISTFPALWGGVVAETCVELTKLTGAAVVPPKVTLAPF